MKNVPNCFLVFIIILAVSCHSEPTSSPATEYDTSKFDTSSIYINKDTGSTVAVQRPTPKKHIPVIEIVESKIVYDENFDPYLHLEVKNNNRKSIIALALSVSTEQPSDCNFNTRKTVKIPFHKTAIIKEKIVSKQDNCTFRDGEIWINGVVFSDGSIMDTPLEILISQGE